MRIEEINESRGEVKIRIEDEEDIWNLYKLIREGDRIRAKTSRSISAGSSKEKIPMILTIKVTGMEFQAFMNTLRIKGVIIEGPERFGLKGSHHAIKVYPGRELTIIRDDISSLVKKIKMMSSSKPKVAILAIDSTDYTLAIVRGQGIEWVFEGYMKLPGKMEENRDKIVIQRIKELVKKIAEELGKRNINDIIVTGPGFLKEKVASELQGLGFRVRVDSASSGDRTGVLETIRRGTLKHLMNEIESLQAMEILDRFIEYIAKDNKMALYGLDDIKLAVEANAVDTILISDYLIHHENERIRTEVINLLENAEKKGAKVIIVPRDTEVGERLKVYGDIIAILRYPLHL